MVMLKKFVLPNWNLNMKKTNTLKNNRYLASFFLIGSICLLFSHVPLKAQISVLAHGSNHINLNSYAGQPAQTAYEQTIQLGFNVPNSVHQKWSIRVRLNAPITPHTPNVAKTNWPPDKIRLKLMKENFPNNTPDPKPTLNNLQANRNLIPLSAVGSEVSLIENAIIPLRNSQNGGLTLQYNFVFDLMGGSYLDGMLSDIGGNPWNENPAIYKVPLTFTLYDESNQVIGSGNYTLTIQIHRPLNGQPGDVEPEYGIEVLGGAKDGTLEFATINQYMSGSSVTYESGVKVYSKSGYDLTVKSMSPELTNAQGFGIPVNLVRMKLDPSTGNTTGLQLPQIQLSTSPQLVVKSANGASKGQFFNLTYSTPGTDQRIRSIPAGTYNTTVQFQLIPK